MLTPIVLVIHIIVSLTLIVLILLHAGRGGGLSDMFGGGSLGGSMAGSTVVERNLDRITVITALSSSRSRQSCWGSALVDACPGGTRTRWNEPGRSSVNRSKRSLSVGCAVRSAGNRAGRVRKRQRQQGRAGTPRPPLRQQRDGPERRHAHRRRRAGAGLRGLDRQLRGASWGSYMMADQTMPRASTTRRRTATGPRSRASARWRRARP